jgi:alpha-tubulin suppressor-like RCC1 family protein
MNTQRHTVLSMSEHHVAAVGALGEIFVWGMNNQGQLGFGLDPDTDPIKSGYEKPTYLHIQNEFYKFRAIEVSCGNGFTAILGKDRNAKVKEEPIPDIRTSLIQTDEFDSPVIKHNTKENLSDLVNSYEDMIVSTIDAYMQANNITILEIFKTPKMKDFSFIRILIQKLKVPLTEQQILDFISERNLRIAGLNLDLNYLFELIEGYRIGQGALFILGDRGTPKMTARSSTILYGDYIISPDLKMFLCKFKEKFIVSKISCGANFIIALSVGGVVYTWGEIVGPINDRNHNYVPKNVQFEKNDIIDIAAGTYHCVALSSKGAVYTWGCGAYGSLGFGSKEDLKLPRNVLATVGDIKIDRIYAGFLQTICVPKDGGALCWGKNIRFQFGTDEDAGLPIPLGYSGVINACAISEFYTLIVTEQGKLMIAGNQQRGFKPVGDDSLDEKVFCHVACNSYMFAALTQDGCLYTFKFESGSSTIDLLARPVTQKNPASQPSEVISVHQQLFNTVYEKVSEEAGPKIPRGVVQICCGDMNTYAVSSTGEVLVCGSGSSGQLARVRDEEEETITEQASDEFEDTEHIESTSFEPVYYFSKVLKLKISSIATGHFHVLAITNDKKLFGWGDNKEGQLGLGNFKPTYFIPTIVDFFKDIPVKQAAGGENHTLILTETGDVFAFGSAECGKLGLGPVKPKTLYHSAIQIPNFRNIQLIACGDNHSLAISNEGILYTWGDGWKGQLGKGNTDNLYEPTPISASENFKFADCGAIHTVAIDRDDKVWHWGDAESVASDIPILTPTRIASIENMSFIQVACGEKYTLAITINKKIYGWGKPRKYRLAELEDREEENAYISPTMIFIDDITKITQISAGRIHCAAIGSKGEVYTWGFAGNGRLGDPDTQLQHMCKVNPGVVKCVSDYLGIFKEDEDGLSVDEDEEEDKNLQECLLNQPQELNETVIKENDRQIIKVFEQCIDVFVNISGAEGSETDFYDLAEHKLLNRILLRPFNCTFMDPASVEESEFEMNREGYEALLTTLQLHPCYVLKLLNLSSIKLDPITLLDNIYIEMENDKRLIFTAIYLSQMILAKELVSHPDISFFKTKDSLYRHLFMKIMYASQEDMNGMRSIALDCINLLLTQVGEDKYGISTNPNIPNKGDLNAMTAYSLNRAHVDKRINKLENLMRGIINYFMSQTEQVNKRFLFRSKFSSVTILLVKDFCKQVRKFNGKNLFNARPDALNSYDGVHIILDIFLAVLYDVIREPIVNLVPIEANIKNQRHNLASLAKELKAFFSGEILEKEDYRWLRKIQILNKESLEALELKKKLLDIILSENAALEEEFVTATFEHSLSSEQVNVSICLYPLVLLHKCIKDNIDAVRVSTRSYDPVCLISENMLKLEPRVRNILKNKYINLSLMTKVLRRDQSLARCPDCNIIIPREMAPTNYKPVYELFEPVPPNSAVAIMTEVLSKGPKISDKLRMEDYILNFKERCHYITHDFILEERIDRMLTEIRIAILSEESKTITPAEIQKKTEIYLREIEEKCKEFYFKRKEHFKMQVKISKTFNKLLNTLNHKSEKMGEENINSDEFIISGNIPDKIKRQTLFNLEYGASNRELEEYSDTVTFKLFLNEVRKATSGKDISIELFENIKKSMAKDLKAFQIRTFKSLVSSQIIKEYKLDNFKPSELSISFEINTDKIILICSHKKSKFSLCGQGETSEEIVLFHETISAAQLKEWRDDLRTNPEIK